MNFDASTAVAMLLPAGQSEGQHTIVEYRLHLFAIGIGRQRQHALKLPVPAFAVVVAVAIRFLNGLFMTGNLQPVVIQSDRDCLVVHTGKFGGDQVVIVTFENIQVM